MKYHIKKIIAISIILSFCLWHSYPLWLGKTIGIYRYPDHHIHTYNSYKLSKFIKEEKSIFGWDSNNFLGYPVGNFYTYLGYLPISFLNLITFFKIDPSNLYSFFIVILYLFSALTYYYIGERIFSSILGGLFTSLLFLLDISGSREGGWFYVFKVGVWVHHLSLMIFLWGSYYFFKIITEKENILKGSIISIIWGCALLIHPITLFTLFLFSFSFLFSSFLLFQKIEKRELKLICFVIGFSLLLSLFWYLNFWYFKAYLFRKGGWGADIEKFGKLIFYGSIFEKTAFLFFTLFLISIFFSLKKKDLFITTSFVYVIFNIILYLYPIEKFLSYLSSSFNYILYKRFIMNAKPFFFFTIVYSLLSIIKLAKEKGYLSITRYKTVHIIFFTPILFFSFISSCYYWYKLDRKTSPIPILPTQIKKEILEISRYINKDKEGFFRVGLYKNTPILFGVYINKPIIVFKQQPVYNFLYHFIDFYHYTLKKFSIRYIISKNRLNFPFLSLEKSYNYFYLYRVKGSYDERFYIRGRGELIPLSWGNRLKLFYIKEIKSKKLYLILFESYFPNWKAEINNKKVKILKEFIGRIPVIKIALKEKGLLILRYKPPLFITILKFVSFFTFLLLIVLLTYSRKNIPL